MNKIIISIAFFVFSVFSIHVGAQNFSGEIKTTHTDEQGNTFELEWVTDGSKCVMTYAAGGDWVSVIMDPATNETVTFHNKDNDHYFRATQNMDQFEERLNSMVARKTEATKMINGVECTKVLIMFDSKTTEMWVATGEKFDFYKFGVFASDFIELVALYKLGLSGIPMECTTKDAVGNVLSTWTAATVDRREVESNEMTPPDGYIEYSEN